MYTENTFSIPNVYHSAALETVAQVSTVGTRLLGFIASNASGSAGFIQLFDSASAPSPGDVPILSLHVATGAQTSLNNGAFSCIECKKGIVIALSSTEATYTAVATEMFCTAFYI